MRAVLFTEFRARPVLREVPDPTPTPTGAVIKVAATGVCRSDWHAWQGHDDNVSLPHVAGHEIAGTIAALGENVTGWRIGDRVTVPFVCACGDCAQCASGDQQICARQFQPGSTHWGSFAEYVMIEHATTNLVALPEWLSDPAAAALGCRFGTAFRAVLRQGAVRPGQWVAVHGCGGAGLSAVAVASAAGARVIAVDVSADALAMARRFGAMHTVPAGADAVRRIRELSDGGVQVSLDCAGVAASSVASVESLRPKGKHVQVGLLAEDVAVPMGAVIGGELEIVGSHGIQAYEYPEMLRVVRDAGIDLAGLVGRVIGLAEVPDVLESMNSFVGAGAGVTVVGF